MDNLEIKNQNGRSMIEMLGVLAIIGVLSVGGIAGYSKAMQKYRINITIEQITLIAGNVRSFFAPQKSYAGLNNTVIKKAKLVPDEMWEYKDDGTFKQFTNVFGNSVGLASAHKSSNTDSNAFSISYPIPLDYEVCIELLTQDWTVAGITAIRVRLGGGPAYLYKTPIDLNSALSSCSTAINFKTNCTLDMFVDVNDNCLDFNHGLNACK